MASLRLLTELTARLPGRHKAMLLFSECFDVDVFDMVDYKGGTWGLAGDDAHAALMAATRSNLAIYSIDPTGLSPDAIPLEAIGAFRAVAEVTGGFALINSNSFDETFERIVCENSTYYMLPDFSAEALAMSGVALVARNEPTVLTLRSSSKGGTGKRLTDVPPGAYALEVTARSSAGERDAVSQQIPIRMR